MINPACIATLVSALGTTPAPITSAYTVIDTPQPELVALAQRHGKLKTVGSDAHTARELGRATVEIEPFDSVETFRANLATARVCTDLSSVWIHFASTYAKWVRRLGLKPQPGT